MKNIRNNGDKTEKPNETALHYMQTLAEIARESILILDPDLRVVFGNQIFYKNFRVLVKETKDKFIYDLGNGQWNIPELKKLLGNILPEKKVIKDYEVSHVFESIGEKTIRLNARQVDSVQLIILAMEDITKIKFLEKKLSEHTKDLEIKISKRTEELAEQVKELESINKSMVGRELKMVELKKEIENLKKKIKKNGNSNHKNRFLNKN